MHKKGGRWLPAGEIKTKKQGGGKYNQKANWTDSNKKSQDLGQKTGWSKINWAEADMAARCGGAFGVGAGKKRPATGQRE